MSTDKCIELLYHNISSVACTHGSMVTIKRFELLYKVVQRELSDGEGAKRQESKARSIYFRKDAHSHEMKSAAATNYSST